MKIGARDQVRDFRLVQKAVLRRDARGHGGWQSAEVDRVDLLAGDHQLGLTDRAGRAKARTSSALPLYRPSRPNSRNLRPFSRRRFSGLPASIDGRVVAVRNDGQLAAIQMPIAHEFRAGGIRMHMDLLRQDRQFGAQLLMHVEITAVVWRPVVDGPHEQSAVMDELLGFVEKPPALFQRRIAVRQMPIDRILPVQMEDCALRPVGPAQRLQRTVDRARPGRERAIDRGVEHRLIGIGVRVVGKVDQAVLHGAGASQTIVATPWVRALRSPPDRSAG